MIYKNKNLIAITFLIISINILIYSNNSQKSNFNFFIWSAQDIKLGKLISISFFSGLITSILLNGTNIPKRINNVSQAEVFEVNDKSK